MEFNLNEALVVDGNALAGIFREIFLQEMTISPMACIHCGFEGEMGSLQAYICSPGFVLRCPECEQIIMRIVLTPEDIYLDASGAGSVRFKRL